MLLKSFFRKIIEQNKQISNLVLLFLDWVLVVFRISRLDKTDADLSVLNAVEERKILTTGIFISLIDYTYIYLSSFYYKGKYRSNSLVDAKIQQLDNNNFYKFNNSFSVLSIQQLFLYGLRSF
jgi:hypothetical protein